MRNLISLLLVALLCMASCGKKVAKEQSGNLPPIYPDYTDVTIPANMAPLNFCVKDAEHMQVEVLADGQCIIEQSGGGHVEFPVSQWADMLKQYKGKTVQVSLSVWSPEHPDGVAYKPFSITIDDSQIDEYVAYRLIPPGYVGWNKMAIMQRRLSDFEETPIVENSQNEGGCVNCHNFCQGDPGTMMFHARNANGGTIILKDGKLHKATIKGVKSHLSAIYPNWHPGGRFIVFSANQASQSFYTHSKQKVEVFDKDADILIYDTKTKKVIEDNRFTDTLNIETFPAFSPDGKHLYFCTAKPANLPFYSDSVHFSIVRVAFNASNGQLGAEVDTIYNGAQHGKSAMQPRISPDGRYMLISCAAGNIFHIHYPDAALQVVDLKNNELVDSRRVNGEGPEGFHAWSSNGKWIVFASRKADVHPTRLYFALFKNGKFGKPFMLPQLNPEEDAIRIVAYNVPELVKGKVVIKKDEIASMLTH